MQTGKEKVAEILDELPDDSTYEEILQELAFARMIERGLEDVRAGRAISTEELEWRIRTWRR